MGGGTGQEELNLYDTPYYCLESLTDRTTLTSFNTRIQHTSSTTMSKKPLQIYCFHSQQICIYYSFSPTLMLNSPDNLRTLDTIQCFSVLRVNIRPPSPTHELMFSVLRTQTPPDPFPLLSLSGHSSLFPMEDGFPDDERGDQGLAGLGSPHCFPHQNGERVERYSRKVFVGGLPPDIDEGTSGRIQLRTNKYETWDLVNFLLETVSFCVCASFQTR